MYFKLSDSEKLKWDGNDANWYKPVIEHFSFGIGDSGSSMIWIYILIILACIAGYIYYKTKKDI